MAIAALVVSCVSVFICPLLAAVGAVLGHVARKQIRQNGEDGDGMALAAVIVGWIVTGLTVLVLVGYIVAMGFAMTFMSESSVVTPTR